MKKKPVSEKKTCVPCRVLKFLLKAIAVVVAFCVCAVTLCGCIVGSVALVDVIKNRGGSYYEKFEELVVGVSKKAVKKLGLGSHASAGAQEEYLIQGLTAMADQQAQTEQLLLAELASGAYTPESPFILVNPYGHSPLTALVMFKTEQAARVSIHIAGETKLAEVAYDFDDENTDHMIPVYGLYAGRTNDVTLTLSYADGSRETLPLQIETEGLPDALSHEVVRAHVMDETAYQPGLNFTYMGNNADERKSAFDANGDYRWYLDTSSELLSLSGYCANYNGGNSIFFSVGNRSYGAVAILEMNYLGKLLNAYMAPYGAHHDIEVTPETLLITGSSDAKVKEDFLYEIDRESGAIITTLDYDTMLQVQRDQTVDFPEITNFYDPGDWLHMNSITPHGDDLIISSRHQSTVICNDREGNIKWMLCDPTDYYAYFDQYILTPIGEDFEYQYIQHAVEVMPDQDGNPDTLDILLFDNGDFRKETRDCYSRVVQYRINEKAMTVEQVWEYGSDRTELFSYRHGDADLLPNGNRLGSFEPFDMKNETYCAYGIELKADKTPVWECWRYSTGSNQEYVEYRLDRLNIYAEDANNLCIGARAKLHLGE